MVCIGGASLATVPLFTLAYRVQQFIENQPHSQAGFFPLLDGAVLERGSLEMIL